MSHISLNKKQVASKNYPIESNTPPIVWTIAASDSSGGAGIQADLATFAQFRVHGCSIISKITAQNSQGIVKSYPISGHIFAMQLDALNIDLAPQAIKISVLANEDQLEYLGNFLVHYPNFSVYDPIFNSSTNSVLTNKNLVQVICSQLLPKINLITPNIAEAEFLTNMQINTYSKLEQAGKLLLQYGVKNVLIKGGHFDGDLACDLFINSQEHFYLVSPRQELNYNVHGTGCRLSSAIAANVALGYELIDSVIIAKRYLNSALRISTLPVVKSIQNYIPQYSFTFDNRDTPFIVRTSPKQSLIRHFLPCAPIGLYPIVSNSAWIKTLASSGVSTIQLRIKNLTGTELEEEIVESIKLANNNQIKLFINDYWELAIKHNAYGVHLGQEDLAHADIYKINSAGLRLGISTHSYYDLAVALTYRPSYIALGPVFPTTSKVMPWAAQGVDRLKEWQMMLGRNYQLVAIGGVKLSNIDSIVDAGVKNIALISGISNATDPVTMTQKLLHKIGKYD